ncbi:MULTISPECIES: carbohydrate ABC transporter permease [unclassified Microbacterium]|uniref:carbohydrate ABC transporter permease n=1 Tax=unclassified Microbacterium TaxID=2609290 RepID=UPI0012FA9FD8|nr:sugar ABC transporter permease [Microbacterium sp. MAH-37]
MLLPTVALAPFVLFCLAMAAFPFAHVVQMAFSEVTLTAAGFEFRWTGFENLVAVFADPLAAQAVINTVVFTILSVVGSLICGIIVAILVDRAIALLPLARNVIIWPAIITPVVVSVIWLLILSPTAGGLNKVLETIGLPAQNWLNSGAGAMASLVVVDVWHWSPIVFLFVYAALKALDTEVLEAARVDGASEGAIVFRIVLPLVMPAIAAVSLIRMVMGIKVFDEMYVLTAGGPLGATTLVSQRIQLWFFKDLNFGEAAAFGLLIIVAVVLVLTVALVLRGARR